MVGPCLTGVQILIAGCFVLITSVIRAFGATEDSRLNDLYCYSPFEWLF
jgi:hypothetical protein